MTLSRHSRVLWPALVAAALAALLIPAAAAARPSRADRVRAAPAVERYYASFGPERPMPPPPVAVAPAPRRPPPPAAPPLTRNGPGWNAAMVGGALLVVLGAWLGVLAGRDSMRPRRS
jgi:hypothetical protein